MPIFIFMRLSHEDNLPFCIEWICSTYKGGYFRGISLKISYICVGGPNLFIFLPVDTMSEQVVGLEGWRKNGLIPEWSRVDAVILAWPDSTMDWGYIIDDVYECYIDIIDHLLEYSDVVLLIDDFQDVPMECMNRWASGELGHELIPIFDFSLNDTWMRDVMPLFGMQEGERVAYDFGFNGWGLKFASNRDNQAVRELFFERKLFDSSVRYINRLETILEGGAIDVNSRGELLTTDSVLREANRNPSYPKECQDLYFPEEMGVQRVFELEGITPMSGDDTDGHIDTLARWVDDETIVYCATKDTADDHYKRLKHLELELQKLRNNEGKPYRLVPLPIPSPMEDEMGDTLPATYANFLIVNGAVLVPIYSDPKDEEALRIIQEAMPKYEVVGIECSALVQQHGSLHCITMQVPKGFINIYEDEDRNHTAAQWGI